MKIAACSLFLFSALLARATTLGLLFQDGAVLQRDKPLVIWGEADPGEKLTVKFHSQAVDATAGPDGKWKAVLAPEKASGEGAVLSVVGPHPVSVSDVVVGDVWLCSGQSNMEFRLATALNADKEIAAANFPLIRQFKIPHKVSETPLETAPGSWKVCTPENAPDFTAVGYFFARDLLNRYGVPIGLINSSWGGTQIEEWLSASALRADPAGKDIYARWDKVLADYPAKVAAHKVALQKWSAAASAAKAAGQPFTRRKPIAPEGPGSRWMPAGMYNAMIHPLLPSGIAGVLWYQGEANGARATEYRTLFSGMIRQWRADFAQGDFPFYYVQLANFGRGGGDKTQQQWAFLREAQNLALSLPAVGMAVTIDIGDPTNIHPKNKQEVGRRLALVYRAQVKGEAVEFSGPMYSGIKTEGGTATITFTHAAGLTASGHPLTAFEVAGADRVFHPATAEIAGETVKLSSPDVAQPVAARYAWRNAPEAGLFNGDGLPASPFRSDNW